MANKIRCSVAMATYNGEKYIKEQILSIIKQLEKNDELIINENTIPANNKNNTTKDHKTKMRKNVI